MTAAKALVRLVVFTLALAVFMAPAASAWFEANTTKATKGPIAKFPSKTTFTIGASTFTCESTAATKATGFWTIQEAKESKTSKETMQIATKVGPHEALTIEKWGACSSAVGEAPVLTTVSSCRLQLAQPTKGNNAVTGSVQTICTIALAECQITISPEAANSNLNTATITKTATGTEVKLNLEAMNAKTVGETCGPSTKLETGIKFGEEPTDVLAASGQKLV